MNSYEQVYFKGVEAKIKVKGLSMNVKDYVQKLNDVNENIKSVNDSMKFFIEEKERLLNIFKHSDNSIKINGFHYTKDSEIGKVIMESISIDKSIFDKVITDKLIEIEKYKSELNLLCNLAPIKED